MSSEPYNPLDKPNLGQSIQRALLSRPITPLETARRFRGAGVYALYYSGQFEAYEAVCISPDSGRAETPVYVGKAIPEGGRIGGLSSDAAEGSSLADRLGGHRRSIAQARNLDVADFWVRYLLVDAIWIPLGENVLIDSSRPVWNGAIFGFGNNTPGKGRPDQAKSLWDMLHPGRKAFARLPDADVTQEFLIKRARDYIEGVPLDPLPPRLVGQVRDEMEAAAEAANEAGSES